MLLFQPDGIAQWPLDELALLRHEWEGRLEATHHSGEVAWRPGPLPTDAHPLHETSPGVLVHPAWARRESDGLHLPGGWTLPDADLPAPPPPPRLDPQEPVALDYREPRWYWLTRAGGERPGPASLQEAVQQFPDLVRLGTFHVRPSAVRRIQRQSDRARIELSSGFQAEVMWNSLRPLARALGLPHPDLLDALPERHRPVYDRGLRDWPRDLLSMEADELRQIVQGDPVRLVDHTLWQLQRLVAQGRNPGWGPNPRGLYYNPIVLLADRAGIPAAGDGLWTLMQNRLELFVGTLRLCTYRGLGCVDRGEADRRIGGARPHLLLLVEKESLEPDARRLAEELDLSMIVLGGAPTFIALEFLVQALAPATDAPLEIVSFCDFDPYGWHFPVAAQRILDRYGRATQGIRRLVTPDRFTSEELDRIALPLPRGSFGRPEVERWLEETGGVRGLPLGIYADYLRPYERLRQAFREVTGL